MQIHNSVVEAKASRSVFPACTQVTMDGYFLPPKDITVIVFQKDESVPHFWFKMWGKF